MNLAGGQPIDTSINWVAIPPMPNNYDNALLNNKLFVVVSDERLDAAAGAGALSNLEKQKETLDMKENKII